MVGLDRWGVRYAAWIQVFILAGPAVILLPSLEARPIAVLGVTRSDSSGNYGLAFARWSSRPPLSGADLSWIVSWPRSSIKEASSFWNWLAHPDGPGPCPQPRHRDTYPA